MKSNERGQGTAEIVIMLPLFLILAAGMMFIAYICWQGLKVQQAANLAARIQGQQRIGGGISVPKIDEENGLTGIGDSVPTDDEIAGSNDSWVNGQQKKPEGVYGDFYKAVRNMFGEEEGKKLFIPPPKRGVNSDSVRVVRVLKPPKVFDFQMSPIKLEAKAYGGEDTRMYGLPRWGGTGPDPNTQFYKGQFTKGND